MLKVPLTYTGDDVRTPTWPACRTSAARIDDLSVDEKIDRVRRLLGVYCFVQAGETGERPGKNRGCQMSGHDSPPFGGSNDSEAQERAHA